MEKRKEERNIEIQFEGFYRTLPKESRKYDYVIQFFEDKRIFFVSVHLFSMMNLVEPKHIGEKRFRDGTWHRKFQELMLPKANDVYDGRRGTFTINQNKFTAEFRYHLEDNDTEHTIKMDGIFSDKNKLDVEIHYSFTGKTESEFFIFVDFPKFQ